MNEYTKQAAEFCKKHGVIITSRYLYHGPYFAHEDTDRAVWEITISRPNSGREPYMFRFGQSLVNSYRARRQIAGGWLEKLPYGINFDRVTEGFRKLANPHRGAPILYYTGKLDLLIYRRYAPPPEYNILSALTKSDPGTLEEFCSDCGLNPDSIRDSATYKSAHDEWHTVEKLFHDCLEELQEIN